MQHRIHLITAILLAILALCPPSVPAADKPLVMALASVDSKKALLDTWRPVLDDLSKALGRPVRAVALDDYAGVVWYLAANKAQLAWMGNRAAIEAVDRTRSEILVQTITRYGAGYYAHLITRKDAPFDNEEDVLKRAAEIEFGIGDPNSTSGYAVPGYYLFAARGVDPKKIFKRLTHHNHEDNFMAVARGKLDVATGNSSALARYKARFPREYDAIKVIWTSPLIPSDPILARTDLPWNLKEKVTEFFVGYARPGNGKSEADVAREAAAIKKREWVGFQRSDNSQLDPIRRIELFKKRLKTERDPALDEAAKKRRLTEIDEALKRLDQEK